MAVYKCPLCGFRPTTLRILKKHMAQYHFDDQCPVCRKKSRNIKSHLYHYMVTYADPQHTLLFYLYCQKRFTQKEKKEVRKLLKNVKIQQHWLY